MTYSEDEVRLVASFAAEDVSLPPDVMVRITKDRFIALLSGALAEAVDGKFPPDGDSDLIAPYVNELTKRFGATGEELDAPEIEAIILWIRGDRELGDDLEPNEIIALSILIIYAIVSEGQPGVEEVAAFCHAAIERADVFQHTSSTVTD
ncbi:MAG TPA: hypothetical protein VE172_19945 [Stackebrandtia sp.]|jgi:hypothetical protein|uniref:hypothetical protein n=1 Tax=Stackebrandtia sp. TaxID=2023065 RepID=UPI002D22CBEA|nr:hypothetical protein [Stackebrandtia sp.]HZE41077.1 hypothetical protein [Stackebrandtia sp.]